LVGFSLNLFLLPEQVVQVQWPANDARTHHLQKVLHAQDGDLIDFGVVNGSRGQGLVQWEECGAVNLSLKWKEERPSDLLPITLLVGLSRPQTCRKVIEQASTLGVSGLIFFTAEKSEASYAESSLWDEEWYRLLIKGAEQAFSCHLPRCEKVSSLDVAIQQSSSFSNTRLALDVYDSSQALSEVGWPKNENTLLAVGPERGWSQAERELLKEQKFTLCHMGQRVLRVETAVVASVGYLSANYWPGRGWTGE
jgi:16S rRNA (uracil1498-N3)-methyltransferase